MAVYEKLVRLPSDALEALGDHSGHWWSDPELESVIVEAIHVRWRCADSRLRTTTTTSRAGAPRKARWKTPVHAEEKGSPPTQYGCEGAK